MTCWYCGKNESEAKKSVGISMFGEVVKTKNDNGVESVSYSTKDVVVPRCSSCKNKHGKAKLLTVFSAIFALIAIVFGVLELINVTLVEIDFLRGFILGLAVTLAVGFFFARFFVLKGIKPFKKTKSFEEIKELLTMGYDFGKAPKQDVSKKLSVETSEEE